MEKQGTQGFEVALGNLALVLSKLIAAEAAEKRTDLEIQKLKLAQRKYDDAKVKAYKATSELAAKHGAGKRITVDDLNRIRRNVFGLDALKPAAGDPVSSVPAAVGR